MNCSLPSLTGKHGRQYHLISLLGSGASGRVYRAVDTSSKRQRSCAIKCMSKVDIPQEEAMLQMAEISIHTMVTGSSSHILSLRDVIEDDLYAWVVLDLCEGDLHKAIWRSRVFGGNDRLIKETFLEILDGVSACHQQGVFHRDLKPENILCNADGTGIRIADFGHATSERLCRGILCGTKPYLSPEYWVGDENSITFPLLADIWSLGIILINLVTSRFPWQVAHPSDDDYQAFMEEEDYLLKTLPISRRLNTLLNWILHPRAHRRISIPQVREEIINMKSFYRKPSLPRAAWSREVAFQEEGNLCSYSDSDGYPRVDGNDVEPQVAHIDVELPHAKVWGPVRERWEVRGIEIPAAKPVERHFLSRTIQISRKSTVLYQQKYRRYL